MDDLFGAATPQRAEPAPAAAELPPPVAPTPSPALHVDSTPSLNVGKVRKVWGKPAAGATTPPAATVTAPASAAAPSTATTTTATATATSQSFASYEPEPEEPPSADSVLASSLFGGSSTAAAASPGKWTILLAVIL